MTDNFHYLPYMRRIEKYLSAGGDPQNVALIRDYLGEMAGTTGIAESTRDTLMARLLAWLEYLPSGFTGATAGELYGAIAETREGWAYNTHSTRTANLKAFYLWLAENDRTAIPVTKIKRIVPPKPHMLNKGADDLYASDEILRLLEACRSSRDRAMIATLYETGFRARELADLVWGAVSFDEWGVVITLDAASSRKHSKARYIRLTMAREYLAAWKRDYPGDPYGSARVFLTKDKNPLTYTTLRAIVRRTIKRTGINKPGSLHLFRHSRITHLLQQGVPESVVKMMMWGSISSQMLAAYAHLVSADTDREILRISGIEVPGAAPAPRVNPVQCPGCKAICGPTTRFCPECGTPLDPEARAAVQSREEYAQNSEEYRKILARLRRDLGIPGDP